MDALTLAAALVTAIEAGDVEGVRRCYAPDAVIWHNFDAAEQTVEENLATLDWLIRNVSDRRYRIVRREALPDGFLQQHVLEGRLRDGTALSMPACLVCRVASRRITRLEEYLDPAPVTQPRARG